MKPGKNSGLARLENADPRLSSQAGVTVLEFLGVMLLVIPLMWLTTTYLMRAAAAETNRAAAHHQALMRQAVERYQKQNYATILNASAGGPVQITVPMLRATGALPLSVADTNSHGQAYAAAARRAVQNGQPVLETLLVTTGGNVIGEMDLRSIAGMSDGGGFISSVRPGVVQGASGSYETDLASFGLAPGGGHVATALFFNEAGAIDDYLYRNAVAGQPEVNRMNTSIDMGKNDVLNARNIGADWIMSNGEIRASSAFRLQDANGVFNGGWYMADNTWLRSIDNKNIYTGGEVQAGQINSQGQVFAATNVYTPGQVYGGSIYTPGQVYAGSSHTAGQVYGGSMYSTGEIRGNTLHSDNTIQSAGRMTSGEYLQIHGWGSEGAWCESNGLMSRAPAGELLNCVGNVWRKAGGLANFRVATGQGSGRRNAAAWASCNGNEKLISGGGQCDTGRGFNWLNKSQPDQNSNSWFVGCDGSENYDVIATAWAMCGS